MLALNVKHIFSLMPAMRPIMEIFVENTIPKAIGSYIYKEKFVKDEKEYWLVIAQTKFEKESDADKFIEVDQRLDDLTRTLEKDRK